MMLELLKDNTEIKKLKKLPVKELSKAFGYISHDVLIIKLHA